MSYWRFFAMIITSTIAMLGLMYLNTYALDHVFFSETRTYMAIYMGAVMAIIMLAFMLGMYTNKAVNISIFVGSALVFAVSLFLVRSQTTIDDTSWMSAMIPHHSIAIMTSSRANISDPRVRKLADEIIFAQDKEIAEMRYLVNDIDTNGDAADEGLDGSARIVDLNEALSSAEIAILDLEFLTGDEIAQLFPDGAICTFKYTTTSKPVLAAGQIEGAPAALAKISGDLVRLGSTDATGTLSTEGMSVSLSAPDGAAALENSGEVQDANLVLELDAGLRAGYRGYYGCDA